MVVPFDFNQPEPDPGPVSTWRPLDQRRPLYPLNPNVGTTSGTNSIGVGKYDALQASVRQRPTEGLEFLASYTYGKALSDNVGYYGVGWGQTSVQGFYYLDSTDPLRDYGPSPYDVRHMFSLAANYELPVRQGTQVRPVGPGQERRPRRLAREQHLPDAHGPGPHGLGQRRPVVAGDAVERTSEPYCARAAIDGAGVDDVWLDISCFQHAPAGQFGDSGSASCTVRATGTGTSA